MSTVAKDQDQEATKVFQDSLTFEALRKKIAQFADERDWNQVMKCTVNQRYPM
jgi:hypothetical protein